VTHELAGAELGARDNRLLAGYRPLAGVHDEMVDQAGQLREQWAHVGRVIDKLGQRELARRQLEAARLLANDGVDYRTPGDPGFEQRWSLDPVPVLLGSSQWADIERGVIQRAELLNLVLTDLYGERRLISSRVLPPELVFGHPGFLRPADQIRLPGSQQLFNCAVDLARDGTGNWWALSDRTQTPSGPGYALENRVVISRVFPSMYRDVQAHRLAPFFRTLRSALRAAAPRTVEEPRIVVLTPGPWSATAFEHAFLASYLGYSLVEGADLTVRDGRVWLRSLGQLEPVDVILRRVDSSYCDPLELRSESLLGVPGLLEACRGGRVSVVNTLGSGVLENPGLLPLLPQLCEHLLGESLRMPSVPTWWCGDETGRRHVLRRLDRMVIKSITREPGATTVLGWELSAAQRDELFRRIEAKPYGWVGQEPLELATAPAITDLGLGPKNVMLRAFLVARHDSYVAMPGGLARVATPARGALIANRTGAVYKDVWVAASEPEDVGGFWLRPDGVAEPAAADLSLTSRAAENLFWLGRYAERAEALVRLLRVVSDRRTDFADRVSPAGSACLRTLLAAMSWVTGGATSLSGGPPVEGGPEATDAELLALMTDATRPGSLAYAVRRVRDAAYPVRDQLSQDTWLVLGALEGELLAPAEAGAGVAAGRLARLLNSLLALGGLAAESMVRDQGWRFMDAGRRLERALQLCTLLRATITVAHDTATDSLLLESVLTVAESIITYRRRYRSHAELATVLDLLMLDPDNPRSVGYQLDRLSEDMAALGRTGGTGNREGLSRLSDTERLVLEASSAVRLTDLGSLAEPAESSAGSSAEVPVGQRPELAAFLDRLIELLERAGDALDNEHFAHLLAQRPMPTMAGSGHAGHLRLV
jgi:uncharacterized circularly permuted ATP-grasp superfamily protein/uncharacterized alpha-E superfamily protein